MYSLLDWVCRYRYFMQKSTNSIFLDNNSGTVWWSRKNPGDQDLDGTGGWFENYWYAQGHRKGWPFSSSQNFGGWIMLTPALVGKETLLLSNLLIVYSVKYLKFLMTVLLTAYSIINLLEIISSRLTSRVTSHCTWGSSNIQKFSNWRREVRTSFSLPATIV